MTSERLFNSFIKPQKLLYPPPKQISGYAPEDLPLLRTGGLTKKLQERQFLCLRSTVWLEAYA